MISFTEFLAERLQNTLIFEMAFDKRTMENKIRNLENQINLHLIKLIRYEDKINERKHINDIMNWLYQVQRLDFNKKGRKFAKELYFKLLFEEPITDSDNIKYLQDLERGELNRYTTLAVKRNYEETMIYLEGVHREISKLLSEDSIYDIEYALNKTP